MNKPAGKTRLPHVRKPKKSQYVRNMMNDSVRDYHVYVLNVSERMVAMIIGFIAGGLIGITFYSGFFKIDGKATVMTLIADTMIFAVAGLAGSALAVPIREGQLLEKQQKALRAQFRDMLESVSTSLAAGETTIEAFQNAYQDMCSIYTADAYISRELKEIKIGQENNISIEAVLGDFASRSDNEDIESFYSVFRVSYREGAAMAKVMQNTYGIISEKMAIEDEIQSKIAANRLELNAIMISPLLIILLLRLTSDSFADGFTTPAGVAINTAALMIFAVAYFWGQKIVQLNRKVHAS